MANYTLNYTGEEIDHLLEKIDTSFGETTVTKDDITWDGNTDGLYSVMGMFYNVSSVIPTLEELQQGGSLVFGGNEIPFTSSSVLDVSVAGMGNDAILILNGSDPLAGVVLKAGATVTMSGMTATFDKTGIYFMNSTAYGAYTSSLTINNYEFVETEIKPLDTKYLPYLSEVSAVFSLQTNAVGTFDSANVLCTKPYGQLKEMSLDELYKVEIQSDCAGTSLKAKPVTVIKRSSAIYIGFMSVTYLSFGVYYIKCDDDGFTVYNGLATS